MNQKQLVELAIKARENSYSPYSKFKVGAALVTKSGEVFLGANIENASYPLCMCAERNALYNAINHGYNKEDFAAIAVVGDTAKPITPCGACRQVMSELLDNKAPIYMANLKGDVQETNMTELLPFAFDDSDL
ncbi:MAG: cytidine deaminase [Bacilli bacterium]|jgi:cytidine deaminase